MKNLVKIFLLTCIIILPCSLSAQSRFSFGVNGGFTAPTGGDVQTYFNSGYNVGGEAELDITGVGTFYADLVYNSLTPKDAVLIPKNLNITEVSVGYRRDLFNLGAGSSKVFIDAGVGLYSSSEYNTGAFIFGNHAATSDFGVNGGIGASFPLSASTRFIGKFKYNTTLGVFNVTYVNISGGINFKLQ